MPNAIISGVPFVARAPQMTDSCDVDEEPRADAANDVRLFDIQVADSAGARSDASILINRMYATRGYLSNGLPSDTTPQCLTLVASEADTTIGTITLGFDGSDGRDGLLVDALFGDESQRLRDQGKKLCEFTKLAMDPLVQSRRVLASLFHVATLYAHCVMGADTLLIEVNPRHVAYYRRMLDFQAIGEPRMNERVNAPAVLMALDLAHLRRQVARLGGLAEAGGCPGRSMYPWFFDPKTDREILKRARRRAAIAGVTDVMGVGLAEFDRVVTQADVDAARRVEHAGAAASLHAWPAADRAPAGERVLQ